MGDPQVIHALVLGVMFKITKVSWDIRTINGHCKGISPENMALYGTVPPF